MSEQQNILLRVTPTMAQMLPGETMDIAVSITNTGTEVERYELMLVDFNPSWYRFSHPDMLLYPEAPGNEGTTTLTIALPEDATPGSYLPSIRVTSNKRTGPVGFQPVNLTINQPKPIDPDIDVVPDTIRTSKRTARFRVNLHNPNAIPLSLRMNVEQEKGGATASLTPPVVRLAPNSDGYSIVEIQPVRRNIIRADKEYKFLVGADDVAVTSDGAMFQAAALLPLRAIITSIPLAILFILLPLIGVGFLIWILWPRPAEVQAAVLRTVASTCAPAQASVYGSLLVRDDVTDVLVYRSDSITPVQVAQESSKILPGIFANMMSVSANGQWLTYVTASNEAMDNAIVYVVNLQTRRKDRVDGIPTGMWISKPVLSADGGQLAYVRRNGNQLELWGINLTSLDRKSRLIAAPAQAMSPEIFYGDDPQGPLCFSNDGKVIIIGDYRSTSQTPSQTEVDVSNGRLQTFPKQQRPASPATAIRKPGASPLNTGECFVNNLSVNAVEWRDQQMKSRGDRIAEAGCPLTAAAMVLNYYKINTDPNELNNCLDSDANPFTWEIVASKCSNGQVQGGKRDDFNWETLNVILKSGRPAVVGLLGGQRGTQFVVVTSGNDGIAATYRVNDPWDGSNWKTLGYYLDLGYQLRWLVDFTSTVANPCTDRTVQPTQFASGFTLSSPTDGQMSQQAIKVDFNADPTNPAVATLYFTPPSVKSDDPTATNVPPAPTATSINTGVVSSDEGSYKIVFEANPNGGTDRNRTTIHYVIDRTPPTIDVDIAANVLDDNPTADGFRTATRIVPLNFKTSDALSSIATIQYRIATVQRSTSTTTTPTPAPTTGAGSVTGLQVTSTDWRLFNNDATTKPILLDSAGAFEVFFRAIDGAGNISTEQSFKVIIPDAVAAGRIGTGAGAGAGGTGTGTGAGAGGTTSATGDAPIVPVGSLVLAPPTLTYAANIDNLNLQMNNNNPLIIAWQFQQPLPPEAIQYLSFSQQGGNVPGSGSLSIPVKLVKFNTTGQPINFTLNVTYNNNTAAVPLNIQIAPQPAPAIAFTSPQPGIVTAKSLNVTLSVNPTGLAKPTQAKFTGKFIPPGGTAQGEFAIPGLANSGNNWTVTWDVSSLPPQSNMQILGQICWAADDASCQNIPTQVAGLTIPNPTVRVALNPDTNILSVYPDIVATISSGTVDHLTYVATFKDTAGAPKTVTLPVANAGNGFKIKWDTSQIPPQAGIGLTAKACWTQSDDDALCLSPVPGLPTNLTVEAPTIQANPILTEIPVQLVLSGTIAKLNKPTGQVFVNYSFKKIGETNPTPTRTPATLTTGANGTGTWTLTIDTSGWAPQPLTFTPKVCWDATGPDTDGVNCFPVQAPLAGLISPLTATLSNPPADVSVPVSLTVTTNPPGRVQTVSMTLTYQTFAGGSASKPLPSSPAQVTTNAATASFDTTAFGLKPGSSLSLNIQACSSTATCGTAVAAQLPNVPNTTVTATPDQTTLAATALPASVPLSFTFSGRAPTTVVLTSTYNSTPNVVTPTLVSVPVFSSSPGQIQLNTPLGVTWDTRSIPPQDPGISMKYTLCWSGSMDNGCIAETALYNSLKINMPSITAAYIGSNSNVNYLGSTLPVPLDSSINTASQIQVPLVVSSTGTNVYWQGSTNFTSPINSTTPSSVAAFPVVNNGKTTVFQVPLNMPALQGTNFSNISSTITLSPVWAFGSTVLTYTNRSASLSVQPLAVQVNIASGYDNGSLMPIAPPSGSLKYESTVMISRSTTFNMTFTNNSLTLANSLISNVNFSARFGSLPFGAVNFSNNNPKQGDGSWILVWDHFSTSGGPLPGLPGGKANANDMQNVILSWALCGTAGCPGAVVTGALNQSPSSGAGLLKLGAINMNGINGNTIDDYVAGTGTKTITNGNLPPKFSQQIESSIPITYVREIRVWAFPTSAPVITNRVNLAVRFLTVPINSPPPQFLGTMEAYWDDVLSNLTPSCQTFGAGCFISKLFSNGVANTNQISYSLQYCLKRVAAVADEAACSDWAGINSSYDATNANNSYAGWKSKVSGTLPYVTIWRQYEHNNNNITNSYRDPYYDWLAQDVTNNAVLTSRTLKLEVIPLGSSSAVATSNVEFYISYVPTGTTTSTILNICSAPSGCGVMTQTGNTFSQVITMTNLITPATTTDVGRNNDTSGSSDTNFIKMPISSVQINNSLTNPPNGVNIPVNTVQKSILIYARIDFGNGLVIQPYTLTGWKFS